MKLVFAAIAASIAIAIGVVTHFTTQRKNLDEFCRSLPVGMPISEVREAAVEHGFEPRMEPYAQMRIVPGGWHYARPSCRVFFNNERTVEYRISQDG